MLIWDKVLVNIYICNITETKNVALSYMLIRILWYRGETMIKWLEI